MRHLLLPAALVGILAGATSAAADPKFLEPYGSLFSARPPMRILTDKRPVSAFQGQDGMEEPARRLLVSPFVFSGADVTTWGLGVGYANTNTRLPWSVGLKYYNLDSDAAASTDTVDLDGRVVVWAPDNRNLPVVSVIGRYQDYDDLGERIDLLLAADQRLTDEIFATVNLGWADHVDGVGSDLVAGFGATWRSRRIPRLSLSLDYVLDNEVDREDFWSASAIWTFDHTSSVRIGGGKHGTVFANYFAKWDK